MIAALMLTSALFTSPDSRLTPGVIDTTCTIQTLRFGTRSRRLTTPAMKNWAYAKYGLMEHTGVCAPAGCEVDHRVPLEVCGADNQDNLWPQPYAGPCNAHDKDLLEDRSKAEVISGAITLQQAQARFLGDWTQAYAQVFGRACVP